MWCEPFTPRSTQPARSSRLMSSVPFTVCIIHTTRKAGDSEHFRRENCHQAGGGTKALTMSRVDARRRNIPQELLLRADEVID